MECGANITTAPSEQLRRFYYDTVNFDPRSLAMTADFAGYDRLLAGSDYPQKIGSLDKMVTSIDALNAPSHLDAIYSGNADRLLDID